MARAQAIDLPRLLRARADLDRIAAGTPGALRDFTARDWKRVLLEENAVGETKVVSFRLPVELLERIDAYAELLKEQSMQSTGIEPGRVDVVKLLLGRALDAAEQSSPKKKPRKK